MREQELRDSLIRKSGYVLPAIAAFFSYLVFNDNEWLAALIVLSLAPVFILRKEDGLILIGYGIAMMGLAAIVESNGFAITSYWMLVCGTLVLGAELLEGGRDGAD